MVLSFRTSELSFNHITTASFTGQGYSFDITLFHSSSFNIILMPYIYSFYALNFIVCRLVIIYFYELYKLKMKFIKHFYIPETPLCIFSSKPDYIKFTRTQDAFTPLS